MRTQTLMCWITLVSIALVSSAQAEKRGDSSIQVVYNHEGADSADELLKRGGFSAHVQLGESSVLFDVGGEASIVLENLQRIGVDLAELDAVAISHNHWDHVYGLPGVMSGSRTGASVFVPAAVAGGVHQQFPRATVVAVQAPRQVAPGVWLTGPLDVDFMGAALAEQALVLEHPDGLHILAGCSHPGIVSIVERAKEMFPDVPIALVAGGFHLRSTGEAEIREIAGDLQKLGVERIGPSHCTGDTAKHIFRQLWGEAYIDLDLGDTYRF